MCGPSARHWVLCPAQAPASKRFGTKLNPIDDTKTNFNYPVESWSIYIRFEPF